MFWMLVVPLGRGPTHFPVESAAQIGLNWRLEQQGSLRPGLLPSRVLFITLARSLGSLWSLVNFVNELFFAWHSAYLFLLDTQRTDQFRRNVGVCACGKPKWSPTLRQSETAGFTNESCDSSVWRCWAPRRGGVEHFPLIRRPPCLRVT